MPKFVFFCPRFRQCGAFLLLLLLNPLFSHVQASDDDLEVFLDGICTAAAVPPNVFIVCSNAFTSGNLAAPAHRAVCRANSRVRVGSATMTNCYSKSITSPAAGDCCWRRKPAAPSAIGPSSKTATIRTWSAS
jgi:hypothetical protein